MESQLDRIEAKLDQLLTMLTMKPKLVTKLTDEQWLEGLCQDKAYEGIDVRHEFAKCQRWCQENKVGTLSRRRFIAWLNRAERPVRVKQPPPSTPPVYTKKVETRPEGVPPPPEVAEKLSKLLGRDLFNFSKRTGATSR